MRGSYLLIFCTCMINIPRFNYLSWVILTKIFSAYVQVRNSTSFTSLVSVDLTFYSLYPHIVVQVIQFYQGWDGGEGRIQ